MRHRRPSLTRALPLMLAVALVAGCNSDPITKVEAGDTAKRAIGGNGVTPGGYAIAPGDRIKLVVFGDDKMTGEYGVNESGAVAIPLLGDTRVVGKSSAEAAESIARGLSRTGLLRDPRVTVEVLTFKPFYILGEVTKPGEYPYRPGMSLFQAVAIAGGYTYRADEGEVFIRKSTESAERKYDLNADIAVMPGDVIRVPERYF